MTVSSDKQQSQKFILVHSPDAVPNLIQIQIAKTVKLISFDTGMKHPLVITI